MRLLKSLTVGLLTAAVLAPAAQAADTQAVQPVSAQAAEETGTLRFRVKRGGDPIGTHALTFRRDGERLTVDVAIDLEVGLGPLTLFEYRHRNTTTWQGGQLAAMETETDDDGDAYRVRARRTNDGALQVETQDATRTLPGGLLPSTYWLTATTGASALLNTQKGTEDEVRVEATEKRTLQLPSGERIEAQGYVMRGEIDTRIWYGPDGHWVGLAFDAQGEEITYELVERSGYLPTRPPQGATAAQTADQAPPG